MSKEVDVLNDPILRDEALSKEAEWERSFNYANTSSDEFLEFIPKGHVGYKAIGLRKIKNKERLGYEIVRYPDWHDLAGQPVRLQEFEEAYLMACPMDRYLFNQKLRDKKLAQSRVYDMSDVVKGPRTASGADPIRPLGDREE